ncbi:MAG TPA: hypothetical protein VFB03_03630 [Candidatus Saccharimonadales bacterium]|nr:hypothetical protein [Candidatus Saccharimonadales bacterium]
MKKIKIRGLLMIVGAFLLLLTPAMAVAEDGNGGDTTTTDNTAQNQAQSSDTDKNSSQQQKTDEEKAKTDAEHSGSLFLAELKAKVQQHTVQEKAKNCQAAKHGLETKLNQIQKNGSAFETKIDSFFQKGLDYQKNHNVSPANFDQLVSTANDAQAKAKASVDALKSLNVNIDCTTDTVAQNVATFRAATSQAKTDLLAYKAAVKAVLKSLISAGGEQ